MFIVVHENLPLVSPLIKNLSAYPQSQECFMGTTNLTRLLLVFRFLFSV